MTQFRASVVLNQIMPVPESRTNAAAQSRKQSVDAQADVTIIGAGFAGLTAGALLAKDGLKVQVLERDVHPGGCAASFTRTTPHGDFRFAVGATVAAGLEPGGILNSIYKKLGLHAPGQSLKRIMRVHLNAQPVEVSSDRNAWKLELMRAFPGQAAAKQHFWQDIQNLADTMHHVAKRFPSMPFRSVYDVLDTARGAHPGAIKVLFSLQKTVGQLLEQHRIQDPAHKAFIDGQLLDSMQVISSGCALPNGAYALEVYRFGAQYVPGGLSSIAQDLATSITDNGGMVHYATRAREILTEKNRVVGVQTHARVFKSNVVISSAPVPDTLALLGSAKPAKLEQDFLEKAEVWGALTVYIGIHEHALPKDFGCFEQITDFNDSGILENFLVSTSPAWDTTRAPSGFRAITISTHVRATDWFGLSDQDYKTKKTAFGKRILHRLEELFAGFNAGIVHLEIGTPRTFQGFTLHSFGRVGGIPQTISSANFNAIHHDSGIAGLYLAGETIFPGQGTLGVSVSGFNAYRSSKRYLLKTKATVGREMGVSIDENISK
jgi:C-3',4' desaturase CrtD